MVSQSYEPLPKEEEDYATQAVIAKKSPRKKIVSLIAALTFVILLVVLSLTQSKHSEIIEDPVNDEFASETSLKSRVGTQYLLGAGKADITG